MTILSVGVKILLELHAKLSVQEIVSISFSFFFFHRQGEIVNNI